MDFFDVNRSAQYFEAFSTVHAAPNSKLYEAFAAHIAASPDLLELAAKCKKGQPPANLLFATVHYLLREQYPDDALAHYYPTLGGNRALDPDTVGIFERFIWDHEREILPIIANSVTNTNEVARCAALLPGFATIAAEADTPLHLVEIGPSCGLNLIWDRYRYRYDQTSIGDENCSFELSPELRRPPPPQLFTALPKVASRSGLELHPVNIDDPETLAWQLALIWPEHVERANRIVEAFGVARSVPMRIRGGDAVGTINEALAAIPADGAICVFHSFCMYQIPQARKAELSEILREFSATRPIWRLGFEWIDTGDGIGGGADNGLGIARYKDGEVSYQRLSVCDAHGRWIDWHPIDPIPRDYL